MRTVKWNALLSCLCGLAVVLGGVAVSARADVTTEKGASILIFPKVRADGTFDTIIQIANTSNSMRYLQCFYVNASLLDSLTHLPCTVPSATCVPQCQETDFTIWLTKQQPTHWSVSEGRYFNPNAGFGTYDSGFVPGHIPPVTDFVGELKCIEVDASGNPSISNSLKGEATLVSLVTGGGSTLSSNLTAEGDVAKYNAIGIQGNPDVAPVNPLLLDGGATYNACPAKLILNHFTSGAPDIVVSELTTDTSAEFTDLTLVPCNEDFENQIPKSVTVQFLVYNEFEERYSTSITVSCFLETELANIGQVFTYGFLGTEVAQAIITPVVQADGSSGGLVGIAERITTVEVASPATAARAAYNLHSEGSFIPPIGPDQITLPAEQ
ncbi:MAG: hypothetical protein ABSA52_04305 [Candidatus Binatia bacterium]|jgi:hypothetical protein